MNEINEYSPEEGEEFVAPTTGEVIDQPSQKELAGRHTLKELDWVNRNLREAREQNDVKRINEFRRIGNEQGFGLNEETKFFEITEEQKKEYGL